MMSPAERSLQPYPARRSLLRWGAAIMLITLIAYLPAIHAGFIWDDETYVTENELLHDLGGLGRIWIPRQTPQYYPMVFTTFWLEYQLWELNPMGYHIVNVLLHGANAVLLWMILARLGVPGAWLIGAVFALHPVHVESVAWITERKNVLSLFFYLLAAMAYLECDRRRFSGGDIDSREAASMPWALYALSLGLFILALLSKTVTCSLPAALILVMLWLRRPITIARLAPLAPMFIIGFLLAMLTAAIERTHVGAVGEEFAYTFTERTLIATRALLFYPWKLLWPEPLMFIYPRWDIDATNPMQYLPLLICIAVGIACLAAFMRGVRGPFVALSFYAGTVFPALGYFNVYPHIFSFVADHFVYHASIGVIAFVIGGGLFLLRNERVLWVVAAAVLPVFFVLTWRQGMTYESAETVYRDTLAKNPNAWMPHNNLSSILLDRAGAAMEAGRFDLVGPLAAEAQLHAEAAIAVRPRHHTAHFNRSEALRLQGRLDEAMASADYAAEILPHFAEYRWQRGRLFEMLNRPDDAIVAYAEAVARGPNDLGSRLDLARVLTQQGRIDEAEAHWEAALVIDPEAFSALGTLAEIRNQQERFEDAIHLYNRALVAAKTRDDQFQIVTRIVRFLTHCPDPRFRNLSEAQRLAEDLIRATQGRDPAAIVVFASVLFEQGQHGEAIRAAERAIELAREYEAYELAEMIQERLEEFRTRAAETQAE